MIVLCGRFLYMRAVISKHLTTTNRLCPPRTFPLKDAIYAGMSSVYVTLCDKKRHFFKVINEILLFKKIVSNRDIHGTVK